MPHGPTVPAKANSFFAAADRIIELDAGTAESLPSAGAKDSERLFTKKRRQHENKNAIRRLLSLGANDTERLFINKTT